MKRTFDQVAIGETFSCNGNNWLKQSSRTAAGIWPACLPDWAYFRKMEVTDLPLELKYGHKPRT